MAQNRMAAGCAVSWHMCAAGLLSCWPVAFARTPLAHPVSSAEPERLSRVPSEAEQGEGSACSRGKGLFSGSKVNKGKRSAYHLSISGDIHSPRQAQMGPPHVAVSPRWLHGKSSSGREVVALLLGRGCLV